MASILTASNDRLNEKNFMKKQRVFPRRAWIILIEFLSLSDLTRNMMNLNRKTRKLVETLNCTVFETFVKSYGLSKKILQSEVLSNIDIISLVKSLEQRMSVVQTKKDLAHSKFAIYIKEREKKNQIFHRMKSRKNATAQAELDLIEEKLEEFE